MEAKFKELTWSSAYCQLDVSGYVALLLSPQSPSGRRDLTGWEGDRKACIQMHFHLISIRGQYFGCNMNDNILHKLSFGVPL